MDEDKIFEIQHLIDKYKYKLEQTEEVSKKLKDLGLQFTIQDFQFEGILKDIINDLNMLL